MFILPLIDCLPWFQTNQHKCNSLFSWNLENQGILVASCVVLKGGLVISSVYKGTLSICTLSWLSYPTERMSKGSGIIQQSFEYYLVLDFESTCQEGIKIDPQEIIEFPCLLVRADDLCLVDQVLIIKTHLAHIQCFSMHSGKSIHTISIHIKSIHSKSIHM